MTAQEGRPPTDVERRAAIDLWKQTEVLYREGLARHLESDDPDVRARIAGKLRDINDRLFIPRPLTDDELDAWLTGHREVYETPLRYDFEQVFASRERPDGPSRADAFLGALEKGASPRDL